MDEVNRLPSGDPMVAPSPQAEASAAVALLGVLHSPACLVDASGRLRQMNAAWQRLVDCPVRVLGESWLQLLEPESREGAQAGWQAALAGDGELGFEARLRVAGAPSRWHLLSLQPIPGEPATHLCVALDIDAIKQREQDLKVQARLQTKMLDISLDCIKLLATDGRLIHANRAGCQALGIAEGGPFGMPWLDLLPPEVRDAGERALIEARAGRPARFPGCSLLPGQAMRHWDNMLTPTRGPDGSASVILCVSREVTAEREAQELLQRSQQRLAMAASVGGLGVWDYDIRNDVLSCDESWHRLLGRDPAQPIRAIAEFRPLIHPDDVDRATEVDAAAAEVLAHQGHYKIEFRVLHTDGTVRWMRSVACVLPQADGEPARAVGYLMDITDLRRGELALQESNRMLEQEKAVLTRQSQEDSLTGLANRRFLDAELSRLCAQLARREPSQTLAVAMVDIDYFKTYNDRYGHLNGDAALRGVAAALQSIARRTDLVARYGGEEFVLIFPGMAEPEPLLQRLGLAVEALGLSHGASPLERLTISCGCVVFESGLSLTPEGLLAAVDAVLYEAKAAGRNRYLVRVRRPPA